MKIPVYESKIERTTKPAGIAMQVQASPSAFSQGARAAAQLFSDAADVAYDYGMKQKKLRVASESTAGETIMETAATQAVLDAETDDPSVAEKNFRRKMEVAKKEALKGATESLAQSQIESSYNVLINSKLIDVRKSLRAREIDGLIAKGFTEADQLIQSAAAANPADRQRIDGSLFGVFGLESPTGRQVLRKPGIYQVLADNGLISQQDVRKYEIAAKQKIDRSTFRKELEAVDRSQDPDQVATLRQKLSNPSYLPGMKTEDRDGFAQQLTNLQQALEQKATRLAAKAQSDGILQVKAEQNALTGDLLSKIYRAKSNPEDAQAQAEMPSELQIIDYLQSGELRESQATMIRNSILDLDAETRDGNLINDFHDQLDNIQKQDDLDNILDQIDRNVGKGKRIPFADRRSLKDHGVQVLSKSKLAKDKKQYLSSLKSLVGADHMGQVFDINKQLLQQDAILTYHELVNDIDNPMDPAEAFRYISDQFVASKTQSFLAPGAIVRAFVPEEPNASKWTSNHIAIARQRLAQVPTEQLSHEQKAFEFETLDMLQRDLADRTPVVPADPNAVGSGDVSSPSSWTDSIRNFFNSDESVSDELRSLEEGG